jgi:hypothetical protein
MNNTKKNKKNKTNKKKAKTKTKTKTSATQHRKLKRIGFELYWRK